MGKHSGRAAFKDKLRELGYELGDNAFQEAFVRFKDLADRKKHVYDADIVALVDDEAGSVDDRIKLVDMEVDLQDRRRPPLRHDADDRWREVTVRYDGTGSVDAIFNAIKQAVGARAAPRALRGRRRHRRHRCAGERCMCGTVRYDGTGSVDAIFNAIKQAIGREPHLVLYAVDGVTGGTDAQAVHVRLEMSGRIVSGNAAEPDTLVASARAYLNAYNRLLIERGAAAQGATEAVAGLSHRNKSPPHSCYTLLGIIPGGFCHASSSNRLPPRLLFSVALPLRRHSPPTMPSPSRA